MRIGLQRSSTHSVPLVGIVVLLAVLGSFIIAGPILLRSVEQTQQSVTDMWLAYLRLQTSIAGNAAAAGSATSADQYELVAELNRAQERVRANPFFQTIQRREPRVGTWLEQIRRGIETLGAREAADLSESNRAFVELTQFMADHSRQQYRALQTMIWSALLLLVGIAAILARLYAQNRRLAASLNTALEAKSKLVKETHHRVKNNLALVASLVSIKESSLGGTVDLSDLQRRIDAVEHVHDMLSRSDTGLAVPMKPYLEELFSTVTSCVGMPGVESHTAIDPLTLPAKKAVAVGIIVNEAVANAVKHGFGADEPNVLEVTLKQSRDGQTAVLTVSNSGRRLPADFSVDDASSLGLQLVSGLAEQLSGTLEIRSEPMTALVVKFPLSG